ncbi:MAG: nucleoside-diphosphate-sugar epimerase/2'-5' RNA ligase [Bacteriovoracaceae bacterium]|jgi:nucleoside-diphosphate-sugar epimerase/2'-5' RNA ligase
MKVIIFGGTGFFGKELVKSHLAAGNEVTIVTRGNNSLDIEGRIESLVADRRDLSSLKKVLKERSWDLAYDQIGYCSNDMEILCKALKGKIDHLIFTSTKSVYDYGTEIDESVFDPKVHELKMGSSEDFEYGEGKRQAEAYLASQAPFTYGAFRPPVVIGLGDSRDRWNWHLNKIKNEEEIYFPNLEAKFCVLSSEEAGRILFEMGERKTQGALNFYTANPSLREIVDLMEEGVGKKIKLASKEIEGNHSPYGIKYDWFLSRSKAEKLGFVSKVDFKELATKLSALCFFFFLLNLPKAYSTEKFTWVLDNEVFKREAFVAHTEDKPFGSYLGMNIHFKPVKSLFKNLDQFLKGRLNKKKARSEAHITVITPPEYDNVLKEHISIEEINEIAKTNSIQESQFTPVCIGRGEFKTAKTYYIVVRSMALLKIRRKIFEVFKSRGGNTSQFDPNLFYPHITIGYTEGDLHMGPHGVKKGINSCFGKIKI